eukprot:scaffold1554_cov332-Pavlova_lutheri.AAC.22
MAGGRKMASEERCGKSGRPGIHVRYIRSEMSPHRHGAKIHPAKTSFMMYRDPNANLPWICGPSSNADGSMDEQGTNRGRRRRGTVHVCQEHVVLPPRMGVVMMFFLRDRRVDRRSVLRKKSEFQPREKREGVDQVGLSCGL